MASPLDAITYDNGAADFLIKTFYGNDDSILVTFPFDTSLTFALVVFGVEILVFATIS